MYQPLVAPPDLRITVLSPAARSVVALDVSGDLAGAWQVQYEKTPGGCGAGTIQFGLRYEEAFERGYCTAMNIVEISTGDDVLQVDCAAGADKLYVASLEPYNFGNDPTTPQVYLWDGATLTMRVPVTGTGTDSTGNYITIGAPLAGGGNPTTLPAYVGGATIIGRRRYAGFVARRERPKQNEPMTTMTLMPLANIFNLTMGSYSIDPISNIDIGSAIYNEMSLFGLPGQEFSTTLTAACAVAATTISVASLASAVTGQSGLIVGSYVVLDYLLPTQEIVTVASISELVLTLTEPTQYAHASGAKAESMPRWPMFNIQESNFPQLGEIFSGTRTTSSLTSIFSDFMGAISSGDEWSIIVDHDRTPRLVNLYHLATNTYTYPTTLYQGQVEFEPVNVSVQDQDVTNLFNAVLITGATNTATNQPYSAIVNDPSSIQLYDGLQFDGNPISVLGLNSDDACASYGAGALAASSIAQAQTTLRIYTRNAAEYGPAYRPQGLLGGDAVLGVTGISIAGFDAIGTCLNNCPDSEILTPTLWNGNGDGFVNSNGIGPGGSNAWVQQANGAAVITSPFFFAAPGRTFVLTAEVDASKVISGSIQIAICNDSGVVGSVYAEAGVTELVSTGAVTMPAGTTRVYVQYTTLDVELSDGDLVISQPMLANGGFAQPYTPNYAAPIVYGLASSIATTINSDGDSYQDVTFAPIEPDWNAAIQEAGNALAAQLRQNAAPGTNIGQYTLSQSMFPLVYSGTSLVVSVPTGLGIFAPGTNTVVLGGNTFTLPANAITWVWITTANTYTLEGDGSTVAGAILLGFFQTSGTGVLGFTQKASIGVVPITEQSQLPAMPADQAAPNLTGVSAITYPVVGNATYDAECTFTVDVVSAPWLVGIALFAVPTTSTTDPRDCPYGVINFRLASSGTYTAIWSGIGAGNVDHLYVAYVDGQGNLSPVALVGTTSANPMGTPAFAPIGTTAPNPVAAPTAFTYFALGASTYDAECTIFLDGVGVSQNVNLAGIQVVRAPHASGLSSTANGWVSAGEVVATNGTGEYNITAGGLGAGVAYDIGVRYIGHGGDYSYVYIVGTTSANPQYVTNLPAMPVGQAAPVLSNVSAITYPVIGNATYDATASFTTGINMADWLTGISLFWLPAGSTANPLTTPVGFIGVALQSQTNDITTESGIRITTESGEAIQVAPSGTYTATWPGIGAGNSVDLYVAYTDGQGNFSPPAKVGTTVTNPAATIALMSIATTAPVPTAAPSAYTYVVDGGGTYDAAFTIELNANGTTANPALAEIEVVTSPAAAALASNATGWSPAGVASAPNSSGTYVLTATGMGVQIPYAVGIRYVGTNGSRSYVYILPTATTAAQLAQLQFPTATTDPTTGYIDFDDQSVYETAQAYALPAGTAGSYLSASWNAKLGNATTSMCIWLLYQSYGGGQGYLLEWSGSAKTVQIYKVTSGAITLLSASSGTFATDTTNFHNIEFVATQTTAGTVNLTGVLDGNLVVLAIDTSSVFSAGYVAAQFRDVSSNNEIDPKTVLILQGGSPSSAPLNPQGNIVSSSVPDTGITIGSPTCALGPIIQIECTGGSMMFPSGATYDFPSISPTVVSESGANGVWYVSVSLVLATGGFVYYASQTAPTNAQLAPLLADGVIPAIYNQTLTVTAGNESTIASAPGFRKTE